MSSLNKTMLIGNIGKDPEVLKTSDSGSFVRLTLATTNKFKNKSGEVQKDTQWHTVYLNNVLGKTAATYLKKGSLIYVSGELRYQEWQDKNGQSQRSTAIHAKELNFLNVKPKDRDDHDAVEDGAAYEKAKQLIDQSLGR